MFLSRLLSIGRIWRLLGEAAELGWKSRPKAKSGGGVLGEGAASPSPAARGSGERCELPQRGLGCRPDRPNSFLLFPPPQGGLSWHYNIALLWITKKNEKFLSHSILSHYYYYCTLGDAIWCFVVYKTKFAARKLQEVVFTAAKRRRHSGGGIRHLGNPPRDV